MICFKWYVMSDFGMVDSFEDGQPLTDGRYAEVLQTFSIYDTENVSANAMLYGR